MVYCIMTCFANPNAKTIDASDVHPIYFANVDLVNDFMTWFDERVPLTKLENTHFDTYKAISSSGCLILTIVPVACKGYKNQNNIYVVEYNKLSDGNEIAGDTFTDAKVPTEIANMINTNSDSMRVKVYRAIVLTDKDSVDTLKKYLTSSDDMAKHLVTFPSIEELK